MDNWRVELTVRGRSFNEVKIQGGIIQRYALSSLQFIITRMPLNHILRKCIRRYKLTKSKEKINHLMYRDDVKLFAKNEKRIGNPNPGSENIQSGHKDGIWHRKMCYAKNTSTREYWKWTPSNK